MGRQFTGTCGGKGMLYGCRGCLTYVTSEKDIESTHFNGSTGPATLFRRAWNIVHGHIERRKMTTGWHVVRDVSCVLCKKKLGWMYEMAESPDQMYKEKMIILENALICKISDEITDPLGDDIRSRPPTPNIEESRNSEGSPSTRRSISESSSNYSDD